MGFRSLGLINMRMLLGDFSIGYTSYFHGILGHPSPSPARLLADYLVLRQFIYSYIFASDTIGTLAYHNTLVCNLYPGFSKRGFSLSDRYLPLPSLLWYTLRLYSLIQDVFSRRSYWRLLYYILYLLISAHLKSASP